MKKEDCICLACDDEMPLHVIATRNAIMQISGFSLVVTLSIYIFRNWNAMVHYVRLLNSVTFRSILYSLEHSEHLFLFYNHPVAYFKLIFQGSESCFSFNIYQSCNHQVATLVALTYPEIPPRKKKLNIK